jgi:hypothetical protein
LIWSAVRVRLSLSPVAINTPYFNDLNNVVNTGAAKERRASESLTLNGSKTYSGNSAEGMIGQFQNTHKSLIQSFKQLTVAKGSKKKTNTGGNKRSSIEKRGKEHDDGEAR